MGDSSARAADQLGWQIDCRSSLPTGQPDGGRCADRRLRVREALGQLPDREGQRGAGLFSIGRRAAVRPGENLSRASDPRDSSAADLMTISPSSMALDQGSHDAIDVRVFLQYAEIGGGLQAFEGIPCLIRCTGSRDCPQVPDPEAGRGQIDAALPPLPPIAKPAAERGRRFVPMSPLATLSTVVLCAGVRGNTVELASIAPETGSCESSFPRSAWECRLGRSASARWAKPRSWSDDAERRGEHSHAERGNETSIPLLPSSYH